MLWVRRGLVWEFWGRKTVVFTMDLGSTSEWWVSVSLPRSAYRHGRDMLACLVERITSSYRYSYSRSRKAKLKAATYQISSAWKHSHILKDVTLTFRLLFCMAIIIIHFSQLFSFFLAGSSFFSFAFWMVLLFGIVVVRFYEYVEKFQNNMFRMKYRGISRRHSLGI